MTEDTPFLLRFFQGRDLKYAEVPISGRVSVGRNRQNDVVLNHNSVSRHHATFRLDQRGMTTFILLRDEGSTNGCIVNGRPLKGSEIAVKPGDCIQIGVFLVKLEQEKTGEIAEPADDPEANIVFETSPSSQAALPNVRLRVLYELVARITYLDGDHLLDVTGQAIAESLPFSVLYILLEQENRSPTLFARNSEGPCPPGNVSVSRSLINKCRNEGVAILAGSGADQDPSLDRTAVFQSLKSAMCVPLLNHGKSFGVVYASSPSESVYSREDLQFLILVASNVVHKLSATRAIQVVQAEKEKLETILGSLQEGVILLDDGYRVLTVNTAALRVLGGAGVIGKRLDEALAGFQRTFDLESLPGLSSFQIEEAVTQGATDSKVRPPKVYAATVGKNDGSGQGSWKYVICLRDISEAQHLERMKSIFINRLAHKIVTPLTVVTGVNFLVAEHMSRIGDPELCRIVSEGLKQSEYCSALIRQFVDSTALSFGSGSSALKWTKFQLETLVESALASNADLISERSFKVLSLFQDNVTEVRGDQDKLALVFHHLVQNAVKFGRPGGSLMIGAEADGRMLKISFLDDGPGIPPEEMKHVGQMFYQVDPHNTGEVPGAGFGLWLVREVVRCHGGEVKLSSPTNDEGAGTLVELVLPGSTQEVVLTEALGAPTISWPATEA